MSWNEQPKLASVTLKWSWLSLETPQDFSRRVKQKILEGYKPQEMFAKVNVDYFRVKNPRLKAMLVPIDLVEVVLCVQ